MDQETNDEKLSSRIGFILLSAGCAIGLGNVWRFPYIAGQNGGGLFVCLYLFFLAVIGVPVLMMEFSVGRASQRSIAKLHETLTPEKPLWRLHGLAGLIGNVILMMFYAVVTGWMLIYFVKSVTGAFVGLEVADIGKSFGDILASPSIQIIAMLSVSIPAAFVCALGIRRGVERVTKWMMLALFLLISVLAVHSVLLEGAGAGIDFYLVPNFERMKAVGIGKVIVEAMNHAFFTLSIGIGAMSIFGSYIGKRHTLLLESLNVAVLDTLVAIFAGLIVLPACFAFKVEPSPGPGLIFVTLPNVFNHMAGGRLWGSLFFLFVSCAALTTVLAVFECIVACVCDYTGYSRRRSCLILALLMPILSLPCIFGFNLWSDFKPFGGNSCVLDLEDFIVSNLLLPLGGIAFVLYSCSRYGWGWQRFIQEANTGKGLKVSNNRFLRIYCGYGLPILIAVIFLLGLLTK